MKEFAKNVEKNNNSQIRNTNPNAYKENLNNKIYSNSYNNKDNRNRNINISNNLNTKNEFYSNNDSDNEINSIFNNNKLNTENKKNKTIPNNIYNYSGNSNKIKSKNSNDQIEANSKNIMDNINLLFSDKNRINNIFEENHINSKKIENSMITEKEGENNINLNEKEISKITTLNYINNDKAVYGNNNIINDINSKNEENKYSKTYNKKKEINYNEEFDNNTEDPKLNYLTEFYSDIPQEKESILLEENKSSNNKEQKSTDKDNEEENIKDELEDEVGSIDEFHNINDNRSIISSYVFTSVHLTESRSIAQSTYSKSEYQDGISNYNDLTSSRGGLNFIHSLTNNKEFEFRIDKDANFIPFLKDSKNLQFKHNNSIIFNMQINIKKLKEKIEDKNKLINDNIKEITELKVKIKDIEEESKQYERWIENEEAEKEKLTCFLNFLMEN